MKRLCKSVQQWKIVFAYAFVFCLLCATGCHLALSSDEQIRRFERAGPITPEVDVDSLLRAKIHTGYYRVVPGDILELQMPAVLRVISAGISKWFDPVYGHRNIEPYSFRVSDAGTITLPIVGKMSVVGKKPTEIETLIVNAYYPKYVENIPSVVCKVKEYQTESVTVVGGVAEPGLYRLRRDEMSLVAVLMKAGGIVEDGASLITIQHAVPSGEDELPETAGGPDPTAFLCPVDIEKKEIGAVCQRNEFPDTKGRLTENRGKKDLHPERIDIASEKTQTTFVKELNDRPQGTQSSDIKQELMQQAEKIEQNSNIEPYENDPNDSEQKELVNNLEAELNIRDIGSTKVAEVGRTNSKPIVLPVKGLNIPFADIALYDGDVVEVEKLDPEVFTVLGPVKNPGVFPYPPDAQYNLTQAVAFAGGPDLLLDPRYVTVYRQDANGEVVSATFRLDKKSLAKASNIKIKPGDVISVEMTLDTRARMILKEMLYIRVYYDFQEIIE